MNEWTLPAEFNLRTDLNGYGSSKAIRMRVTTTYFSITAAAGRCF
jgi:hypothetical protein